MSKKSRFSMQYSDCKKVWKRVRRKIDGKWFWVRMLDTQICAKCSDLMKCNGQVQLAVQRRLFPG